MDRRRMGAAGSACEERINTRQGQCKTNQTHYAEHRYRPRDAAANPEPEGEAAGDLEERGDDKDA
jgi:hypothetical protein